MSVPGNLAEPFNKTVEVDTWAAVTGWDTANEDFVKGGCLSVI